jgi:5-deoxy-glucuronate isomerase
MTTATSVLTADRCIVRNTAAYAGRTRSIVPGSCAMQYLHYGRIILHEGAQPIRFSTDGMETGLICLRGAAYVQAGDTAFNLARYDALYVPRDTVVQVMAASGGCDLAEIAAPVSRQHPVQFVSFAGIQSDPSLHLKPGGPAAKRDLTVLIGKNVQASRIMAGVTFSDPGNWTSWPPHEHAAMLEEAYLYIDMPAPAFGVQLVYTNSHDPEIATLVREGDVVMMPAGYHPNVGAPGYPINFLWMMAAIREDVDRQYGVVNVQPEFAATPSGLDAGRSDKK